MAADSIRTFEGAVAVITGGASGIGHAFAKELAHRGASVVLADLQIEEADKVRDEIRAFGGKAESYWLNVTDYSEVNKLIQYVWESNKRIDYLFNNAGIGVAGEALYCELDDWKRVVDVNLMGVIHGVQAAYPLMCQQGFGHIINTASMAGLLPSPNVLGYTTTKHAVVGLSRALRLEAEHYNVRVSVLCPGVIRTPIIEGGKYGSTVGNTSPTAMRDLFEKMKPMDVDEFARRATDDISRNRGIIIHPKKWRWIWLLTRLFPGLADAVGRKSLSYLRQQGSKE
jgi:NAD(P)-dependent dehydrogenase (short-subunit alcohol dehydrogenase family)